MGKTKKNSLSEKGEMRSLLGALIVGFFLETGLFLFEKFYILGTGEQMLLAFSVLNYVPVAGLVLALAGVFLSRSAKCRWAIWLVPFGLCAALFSLMLSRFDSGVLNGLIYLVPALMLLAFIFKLYGKEFFWIASSFTVAIAALLYWKARAPFEQYRPVGLAVVGVSFAAIAVTALLAWSAYRHRGTLTCFGRTVRMLPADADPLFLFGAFGLSLLALLGSLLLVGISFAAVICLGIALFAFAVYYTVTSF